MRYCVRACLRVCVRVSVYSMAHVWRLENNFVELFFFFPLYWVLGNKFGLSLAMIGMCCFFYLMNYLADPGIYIYNSQKVFKNFTGQAV